MFQVLHESEDKREGPNSDFRRMHCRLTPLQWPFDICAQCSPAGTDPGAAGEHAGASNEEHGADSRLGCDKR